MVSTVLSNLQFVRANESSGMSHKRMQREKDGSTFRFVSFRFVRLWLFSRTGSDSVLFPMFRFPSFRIGFGPLLIQPSVLFSPCFLLLTVFSGDAGSLSVGRIVVGIV